ncbi:MAG: polysaccharide lyase 11, partial [Anaerolineae bacterium]
MKIDILREYTLGVPLGQVRSCAVDLGRANGQGMLMAYSETGNIDPYEDYMHFHAQPLQLALFGSDGQMLWHKTCGMGVVPGVWFFPFMAFDLDADGVDEIWHLYNTDADHPLRAGCYVLRRLDALSGEVTGTWPFPARNTAEERLTHAYRFMLIAGYAHGEPVLVTTQGTYGDMFLQGYNPGMELRWERVIGRDEPGARAAHSTPVFDINQDGVDELFWGERLVSLDTGR